MSYYATSRCLGENYQMCVDVCPVECIHFEEGVDAMAFIDPEACIDCALCVPACPVSAIYAEADLPEDEARYAELAHLYVEDRTAAREALEALT